MFTPDSRVYPFKISDVVLTKDRRALRISVERTENAGGESYNWIFAAFVSGNAFPQFSQGGGPRLLSDIIQIPDYTWGTEIQIDISSSVITDGYALLYWDDSESGLKEMKTIAAHYDDPLSEVVVYKFAASALTSTGQNSRNNIASMVHCLGPNSVATSLHNWKPATQLGAASSFGKILSPHVSSIENLSMTNPLLYQGDNCTISSKTNVRNNLGMLLNGENVPPVVATRLASSVKTKVRSNSTSKIKRIQNLLQRGPSFRPRPATNDYIGGGFGCSSRKKARCEVFERTCIRRLLLHEPPHVSDGSIIVCRMGAVLERERHSLTKEIKQHSITSSTSRTKVFGVAVNHREHLKDLDVIGENLNADQPVTILLMAHSIVDRQGNDGGALFVEKDVDSEHTMARDWIHTEDFIQEAKFRLRYPRSLRVVVLTCGMRHHGERYNCIMRLVKGYQNQRMDFHLFMSTFPGLDFRMIKNQWNNILDFAGSLNSANPLCDSLFSCCKFLNSMPPRYFFDLFSTDFHSRSQKPLPITRFTPPTLFQSVKPGRLLLEQTIIKLGNRFTGRARNYLKDAILKIKEPLCFEELSWLIFNWFDQLHHYEEKSKCLEKLVVLDSATVIAHLVHNSVIISMLNSIDGIDARKYDVIYEYFTGI
ncbi:hypothetical protein BKA69DRAFT_1105028 [Paraphysoderma sedebokerense]|nr:hypothetical protein BKA69DRAFT_1105028 [Paraphysoderma sedebokerense]